MLALTQSLCQTFSQAGMPARMAMERTIPKAPIEAVANRKEACWNFARGNMQKMVRMGMHMDMKTTRVSSEGWMITERASANRVLHLTSDWSQIDKK